MKHIILQCFINIFAVFIIILGYQIVAHNINLELDLYTSILWAAIIDTTKQEV